MRVFISLLALVDSDVDCIPLSTLSGFPLEVVIGVRHPILGNNLGFHCSQGWKRDFKCAFKTRFPHHPESFGHIVCLLPLQEAAELFQDPAGRWFSFSISMDTVVVLDKKDLPSHLASLPCVESPTSLKDLFLQLEDSGEVCGWCHKLSFWNEWARSTTHCGDVTKVLRHQSSMFKIISCFKCYNTNGITHYEHEKSSVIPNYKPPERSSWVLAIIPWWMETWPPKSLLHLCWTTVKTLMMTKRETRRSARKTLLTARGMGWPTRTLGRLSKPPKSKQAQSFWLDGVSGHKFLLFHDVSCWLSKNAQTCLKRFPGCRMGAMFCVSLISTLGWNHSLIPYQIGDQTQWHEDCDPNPTHRMHCWGDGFGPSGRSYGVRGL